MDKENQPLVTDELVEFEKWPVDGGDVTKITPTFIEESIEEHSWN